MGKPMGIQCFRMRYLTVMDKQRLVLKLVGRRISTRTRDLHRFWKPMPFPTWGLKN